MTLALTTRRLLSRSTAAGTDYREFWPTDLDFILLQAAGIISGHIGSSAPGDTAKLWLDTTAGLTAPGTWKYHNGSAWVAAAGTTAVASHILTRGAPGTFLTDGDKGDVVVSTSGTTWELDPVAAGARLAASGAAVDAMKDAIAGALEATDARAMVNAIQADPVAQADIKAGLGLGGATAGQSQALVATLGTNLWTVDLGDPGTTGLMFMAVGGGKSNLTSTNAYQMYMSLDGGSTYTALTAGVTGGIFRVGGIMPLGNTATWQAQATRLEAAAIEVANVTKGVGNAMIQMRRSSGSTALTADNSYFNVTRLC